MSKHIVRGITDTITLKKARVARKKKRTIADFCEEVGLVYFGFVSQRDDDHHIVRGMTVSNDHRDHHYCIGTYDSYDVVFVERSDKIITNDHHIWHIFEFDLKVAKHLPHIFIGSSSQGKGFHALLSAKYPSLHPAHLGVFGRHAPAFTDHFSLYSKPEQWLTSEKIFTPDITEALGNHFKGLVMEISDDSLYVYSEASHTTPQLLQTMLKNGIWLAKIIDEKSRHTTAG